MNIDSDAKRNKDAFAAVAEGRHRNPFALLGIHKSGALRVVRTFQPQAKRVELVDTNGDHLADMRKVHPDGLFAAVMPPRKRRYLLRVTTHDGNTTDLDDAYRFPQSLGDVDLYLLGEGSDRQIYNKLGARVISLAGVRGTRFAVWAPNASRVSVVGDFNDWDGRRHIMRLHPGNGIWEVLLARSIRRRTL